jgi:hypothetical protein
VTIIVCPACGYPTLGPDLCAFCRPVAATTFTAFPSSIPGPVATGPEAPAIVPTTTSAREPRADTGTGLPGNFAAAG